MPKKTVDELLAALETVGILKDVAARHEQVIGRILDRLDQIETRLQTLEKGRSP